MNEEEEDKAEKQNRKQYDWLKAYQFKKGQSGNPNGRPPGKSLKTFAREMLESLPDEEKLEYLKTIDPKIVWEMAEGKPKQDVDFKGTLTISDVLDSLEDGQTTEGQDVESQSSLQDTQQRGETRHL